MDLTIPFGPERQVPINFRYLGACAKDLLLDMGDFDFRSMPAFTIG
jgi:hypothetical protein